MTLESQVASLELCKRLKELGVNQESLFYWTAYENPHFGVLKETDVLNDFWQLHYIKEKYFGDHDYQISAFTVAELGEMLPPMTPSILANTSVNEKRWSCGIYPDDFRAETEADARAKMRVYLLEQGMVKP